MSWDSWETSSEPCPQCGSIGSSVRYNPRTKAIYCWKAKCGYRTPAPMSRGGNQSSAAAGKSLGEIFGAFFSPLKAWLGGGSAEPTQATAPYKSLFSPIKDDLFNAPVPSPYQSLFPQNDWGLITRGISHGRCFFGKRKEGLEEKLVWPVMHGVLPVGEQTRKILSFDTGPKYITYGSPGFGFWLGQKHSELSAVVICEGPKDALWWDAMFGFDTVALLGSGISNQRLERMLDTVLKHTPAPSFIIALDRGCWSASTRLKNKLSLGYGYACIIMDIADHSPEAKDFAELGVDESPAINSVKSQIKQLGWLYGE